MTIFNEQQVKLHDDGVSIVSDELKQKLAKKKLSASAITSFLQCPAGWLMNSFVTNKLFPQPPDSPANKGSVFHKIMEDLFALPADERNRHTMKKIANDVINSDEFKDILGYPEALEWLRNALDSYFEMGGKPELVNVAEVNGQIGLEIPVTGKIGRAQRDFIGFVDRLIYANDKTSVIIEDWKTGAKAKQWVKGSRFDEGLPEARQQMIYKILLEKEGLTVQNARLLFPVAKKVVNINIHDEELYKRTIADIEQVDTNLSLMEAQNFFDYQPGVLCAWCPVARICPKADIKDKKKMIDSFNSQPDPADFMGIIE